MSSMMCHVVLLWSRYPHSGECPLKSPVYIGRFCSTFSYVRWGIVEVVNDVLSPVIWADMDELRVCVFFPNRYQELC